MTNEIESLIRIALNQDNSPSAAVDSLIGGAKAAETSKDPARLAVDVNRLIEAANQMRADATPAATSKSSSNVSSKTDVGETVLKTAAMMTGVGPLVTGLLKMFGSDEPEPLPPIEKFSAPAPVSVEAGLTQDRRYSGIRYGITGTPESVETPSRRATEAPTIQVNIQAMDSQSFLDRQDDIARAVREAMLHSSSLNDVVLEL